jgi:hypothetical protein
MSEHRAYVRYSDSVETKSADEEEVVGKIIKIIQSMTQESQTVAARDGRTVRASHAKSTGLLKGELRVLDGLPEPLRQGLFATARSYPAVVRLAQGPGEAKMGVSPDLVAMIDRTLDTSADPDAFRTAVVERFRTRGAEFELRVQLCTSLDSMPVEDASVPWPEDESPYVAVARLVLPPQDAHTLAAHRPLGSPMRARLGTYQALSLYRHQQNGRSQVESDGIEQVPN